MLVLYFHIRAVRIHRDVIDMIARIFFLLLMSGRKANAKMIMGVTAINGSFIIYPLVKKMVIRITPWAKNRLSFSIIYKVAKVAMII